MPWSFTIDMPNAQPPYRITRLLGKGESNAKMMKSDKAGLNILTYGLSLAPSKASGFNLCPHATAGCIRGCLYDSGQAQIYPRRIKPPRIAKSRFLRKFPVEFEARLITELHSALKRANRLGAKLFVRLNVFSDVEWETEMPGVFDTFKGIQFYDYCKGADRFRQYMAGQLPKNLHLTFSRSENNWMDCVEFLDAGFNVAVPFHVKYSWRSRKPLPETFMGYEVIDGDITDLRPFDETGKVVGLRVKGPKAKADHTSGFIIDPATLTRRVA